MREIFKLIVGTLVFFTLLLGCSGNKTEHPNGKSSVFLDCPDSPNCVSSLATDPKHRIEPFKLKKDYKTGWANVQRTVGALSRTKIVSANNSDIHAECRSMIFRFVDDLMLHLNPSNGAIHIRSASRTGYWDIGANRRRVESLRKKLRQINVIE